MESVELYPTHGWDCPNCGRQNFERGIVVERSDEEIQEIKLSLGFEPWEEGVLLQSPDEVTCSHCGHSYGTVDYGE